MVVSRKAASCLWRIKPGSNSRLTAASSSHPYADFRFSSPTIDAPKRRLIRKIVIYVME